MIIIARGMAQDPEEMHELLASELGEECEASKIDVSVPSFIT